MILVNDKEIKLGNFPDNTLAVKLDPFDLECDYKGAYTITWLYENDAELFALICVKRHLDEAYFNTAKKDFTLFMPYIPHARMDRVKNEDDVFTLKYFCEVINSLNFSRVLVRDAHSNVSLALLNNVYEYSNKVEVEAVIDKSGAEALFFPDEGAMKRYASLFNKPYAFGMKARDWETGKIIGFDIINSDNIEGKNVLIVDDICSRGGTFLHSAKALKEAGAKSVSLFVTHLEKTVLDGEMFSSGLIDAIYTSNSIADVWTKNSSLPCSGPPIYIIK